MKKFIISTEDTCDLPQSYIDEHSISIIRLESFIDSVQYGGDSGKTMSAPEFFNKMKSGSKVSTSLVNYERFKLYFTELLKKGDDVLHISFSSGLSGTCENALKAANDINKTSANKVIVVSSLCASLGQGLLVDLVIKQKNSGKTIEECQSFTQEMSPHICHIFVVDDLEYLFRGGRISRTSAIIGKLLNIKPVLHCDNYGMLVPLHKVMTRKASLRALVKRMAEKFTGTDSTVFIVHGNCIDDAKYVADLVQAQFGIEVSIIGQLGQTIGSHSGPGTVALFFVGKDRLTK